ncbi:MAG: response regulator transcription factor [Chloroflexi bacterium]|nr:response regulator transcription factor [Chloroflexota bacterium]
MDEHTKGAQKVLVVEDVAELRRALATALVRAGYEVIAVPDGEEALRAFHSFQPDLALLDILLPGKSGVEVCERIREMSAVPVVMFSAVADEDEKVAAFEKGADDYVVKGTGLRELVVRINAVLRRARSVPSDDAQTRYADDVLAIDFARQLTWVRGEAVDLTPTEYRLLATLCQARGPADDRR